ncbi:MAG: pilin [Nanoarchaeota archaeon]|nr:pilin [Nanoarchaeota archaeon]MBU1104186.1 pilin [Nanoarchaeota archaeon]
MRKSYAVLSLLILALMAMPFVMAEFGDPPSDDDVAAFDQILEPVMKIYNLVKYSATVLAVVVLLFAGVTYMTSGSNPGKREQAKNMVMYVIIGLVVIWAAPLLVGFVVG